MGFFSSIGRVLGGAATGFLAGGPLGAVTGAIGGAVRRPTPQLPALSMPFTGSMSNIGPGGVLPVPGARGTVQRMLPGGQSGYTTRSCLTKDGRMRRIRADGQCYKRPTMNVTNPRAARRAITRIKGVRKMLQSIERELPRRAAKGACGCKGRRGR